MPKTPAYNQQRARARNQTTVAQAKANVATKRVPGFLNSAMNAAGDFGRKYLTPALGGVMSTVAPWARQVQPAVQGALRNPYAQAALGGLSSAMANPTAAGAASTVGLGALGTAAALGATGRYNRPRNVVGYSGNMPRNTAIPREAVGGVKRVARQWGSEIYPEGYTEAPGTQQEGGYGDLGGYGDYGGLGRYADTNYPGYTGAENNYNRAPGYAAKMEENPYWRRALATWRF